MKPSVSSQLDAEHICALVIYSKQPDDYLTDGSDAYISVESRDVSLCKPPNNVFVRLMFE